MRTPKKGNALRKPDTLDNRWVLLIFLVSLLLRFYFLNDGLFHYDDVVLVNGLEQMREKGNVVFATNGRIGSMLLNYPFYAPYAALTGNSAEQIPLITNALFSSLAVLLLILVTWKLFQNQFLALTSGLFFSFSPLFLSQSTMGKEQGATIFFFLLGLFWTLQYQETPNWKFLVGASLAYGFAVMIHESMLVLAPLFLLFGLWSIAQQHKVLRGRKWNARLLVTDTLALSLPFVLLMAWIFWWYLGGIFLNTLFTTLSPNYNPHGTVVWRGLFFDVFPLSFLDLTLALGIFGWALYIFGIVLSIHCYEKKKYILLFLLVWSLLFLYFGNTTGYKSRHFILVLPAFAIFMSIPVAQLYKKRQKLAILCVGFLLAFMLVMVYPVLDFRKDYNGIKEFSFLIQNHTDPEAVILVMEDSRFIEYYANRSTLSYPIYRHPEEYVPWLQELVNITRTRPLYAVEVREGNRRAFPNYDATTYNGSIYALTNLVFDFEDIANGVIEDYHDPNMRFKLTRYYLMRMSPKERLDKMFVYYKEGQRQELQLNQSLFREP